jgi:hypothetical protein
MLSVTQGSAAMKKVVCSVNEAVTLRERRQPGPADRAGDFSGIGIVVASAEALDSVAIERAMSPAHGATLETPALDARATVGAVASQGDDLAVVNRTHTAWG